MVSCDPHELPQVTSKGMLIKCEGIKSIARNYIHKDICHDPVYNGFAAYRATVEVSKIRDDPDLAWILDRPFLNIW